MEPEDLLAFAKKAKEMRWEVEVLLANAVTDKERYWFRRTAERLLAVADAAREAAQAVRNSDRHRPHGTKPPVYF